jgi:hypothetical protein
MSTPPRYLQAQQATQKNAPQIPNSGDTGKNSAGQAAGVVTCEGERVGLAGGDGAHLGGHLRGVAVEWRRRQVRSKRARVQVEALPRDEDGS